MNPRVAVLRTAGTNCDEETAYAFEGAGAVALFVHVNELREGSKRLSDYQILVIPGGFTYGDDVASGRVLATELSEFFAYEMQEFLESEKLILGICNGFQVLVRTGILPFGNLGRESATLAVNVGGVFDHRWVELSEEPSPCVFTKGVSFPLRLPIAHGEGRFSASSAVLEQMESEGLVALRYALTTASGSVVALAPPHNPNGSMRGIAGVTNATGRVLGLMPHPERYVQLSQNPNFRRENEGAPSGLSIFLNAVSFFR